MGLSVFVAGFVFVISIQSEAPPVASQQAGGRVFRVVRRVALHFATVKELRLAIFIDGILSVSNDRKSVSVTST